MVWDFIKVTTISKREQNIMGIKTNLHCKHCFFVCLILIQTKLMNLINYVKDNDKMMYLSLTLDGVAQLQVA